MNERIARLREQSLVAQPSISMERGSLLTEYYQSGKSDQVSIPVARAQAFKYILTHKTICINPGELIVGERGPEPKATPTFPEICTHTIDDLNILDQREKISFAASNQVKKTQKHFIMPFWKGRSLRDRIFKEVDEDWKQAYESGIFTEFMEQRAPGHTVLDDKIYSSGMNDFRQEIAESVANLDFENDPRALDKRDELRAMDIAANALVVFANRHADQLDELAELENDSERKNELELMAAICRKVPAEKPDSYWEALQYYWFVHLGVITELNTWDSFNPGRLDQHLLAFYRQGLKEGSLSEESARELLQAFWIKFNNQPAPPKVGVTAEESNTYTDFCLINIGGVTATGSDAVNEMSYLILDVIEEMRLLQPGSMIQISKKTPDKLLKRALEIIKTGYGQPSIFNADAIISELVRQGKTYCDARNGGASGCVEAGAFGKEAYILTGYFNLPKVLEVTLNNGTDPCTGKAIGIATGDPRRFKTFDQLFSAFEQQLVHFINIKIRGNLVIERLWTKYLPAPFLSILIDDCITRGLDYNAGGARYNSAYIQGVGLGTITDSLSVIKYHVFDQQTLTFSELLTDLITDFNEDVSLHKNVLDETPRYGNDNDFADELAQRIFDSFFTAVDGRSTTSSGHFRINLLPTTSHIYFGSKVGATPDGRRAGKPLSEGISPVQGADRKGPTAVLKSAGKIDHLRTGGTLLNQKFTPQILANETGVSKVASLVQAYFRMDGHHIQFNVVTAETLKKAQVNPEDYRDLIVRVAGYSDYFVDLTEELQNEIIKRTEHEAT